ncbi:TonB-dependent receptor domain-containing protein [Sphingobacterium pedocola]|uniref:TonB-dependent receptor n=1 Tax=Sphingobacterium pedocola TaxID=2082722 RepID=A0ABR9T3A7_9SPHI|nr:TonB-dependent receptor [Sphingobacterium pedocola]MBE8719825.1 TonB-dependent receptor [Sphingobacterium pedocola]
MKQSNKIIVIICMLLGVFNAVAQQTTQIFRGQVLSGGQPVSNANIQIDKQILHSDEQGLFSFPAEVGETINIQITAVGMHILKQRVVVEATEKGSRSFTLKKADQQIEEVEVIGHTKVQEVNRQAYNVTAIDATKLYNTTLDISGALDKVAGIRVRESGGVGSNFNLSLNGFSGNHVRYFVDGIPMDNFGSSFQINNIPINIADRVEVYKGVVPMWLGSDALGGAINIVTADRFRNFVDVSYSYGSFNTHRTVLNAAVTSKQGLTFQLNAFQNYSDNDYKVTVEAADIYTGAYEKDAVVRRFHDKYHNESVIAQVGFVDKSFADRLLVGVILGQNYKEIQTGARMRSVFGQWHRRGSTVMPTLKYKKTDLVKGLDLIVNANYNLGKEQNIDTVNVRYDWYGTSKPNGTNGERARQHYIYKNNEGLATANLNYRMGERHSLALSNVFSTFNRKGHDELNPTNATYELPQKTDKNILGLGYTYGIRDVWTTTVFGKFITQHNESGTQDTTHNRFGYGLASAYFVSPNFQLKTSYELTNRMPTPYEMFGDVENQEANANLKPESSHNVNLGANYSFAANEDHNFVVGSSLIYRYATDFIYNRLNNNQSKLVADNREGVETWGADADARYSYKSWLTVGGSVTYQYLQNKQKYEPNYTNISPLYNDQMPNIPYLFGHADASVIFNDFLTKGNTLNVGYNLLYVHEFYLYWPSRGGQKLYVPKQFTHDFNVVYSLADSRYNIGLEAKNVTNAKVYDNFSLQKPGRAFYVNLRYFINK